MTKVLSNIIITLRPRQNGRHFADDIFKCIFLNENVWIPIKISLKFVPKGPINNIPALVQIMAWRRPGDKPLSEPMMDSLPMHICVTRPQWVIHGPANTDSLDNFHVTLCNMGYLLDTHIRPEFRDVLLVHNVRFSWNLENLEILKRLLGAGRLHSGRVVLLQLISTHDGEVGVTVLRVSRSYDHQQP